MSRLLFITLLFLQGCVVGPNYKKPTPCVSDCWVGKEREILTEPLCDWWHVFGDPLLDSYIKKAACFNHDIAVARANIVEARALCKVAASPLYPHFSADLSVAKFRLSQNSPFFGLDVLSTTTTAASVLVQTLFNLLIDATWEVDLFGKTFRSIEQAQAEVCAAVDAKNDLLITVFGEVAKTYMNIRGLQKQMELTEKNIALLEEIDKSTSQRYQAGLDNSLDAHNIAAEVENVRSTLPTLKTQIYLNIYSLSVLTGSPPECLLAEMLSKREMPTPPMQVELGLRSDILKRRPDVRRAEDELHAATAAIGIAYANFFPSFSLLGFFGFQAENIRKFFDWHSRTYLFADNASQPIFQGGKLKGNLLAAKAEAQAAFERYQQIVLNALSEAESSLTAYTEDRKRTERLSKSVEDSRIVRDLSYERYQKGLIDLKTFLDYERQLISRELDLTTSQINTLIDLISLYKALGGGWECPALVSSGI